MAKMSPRPKRRGAQFSRSLHFVAPATAGWRTRAFTASGLTGAGIDEIWAAISAFVTETKAGGVFEERRTAQRREWLHSALEARLRDLVFENAALRQALPEIEAALLNGELSLSDAAEQLLKLASSDL